MWSLFRLAGVIAGIHLLYGVKLRSVGELDTNASFGSERTPERSCPARRYGSKNVTLRDRGGEGGMSQPAHRTIALEDSSKTSANYYNRRHRQRQTHALREDGWRSWLVGGKFEVPIRNNMERVIATPVLLQSEVRGEKSLSALGRGSELVIRLKATATVLTFSQGEIYLVPRG